MQIELSKEQYRELVKLIYLGNWMMNSFRNAEERITSVEEVEQYIYSLAKQFESEHLIQYNADYNFYDATIDMEAEMQQFIDAYDEDTFWAELADRLSMRDIARKVGPVSQLTEDQIDDKFALEEKYYREFEKNGLRNVFIKMES